MVLCPKWSPGLCPIWDAELVNVRFMWWQRIERHIGTGFKIIRNIWRWGFSIATGVLPWPTEQEKQSLGPRAASWTTCGLVVESTQRMTWNLFLKMVVSWNTFRHKAYFPECGKLVVITSPWACKHESIPFTKNTCHSHQATDGF